MQNDGENLTKDPGSLKDFFISYAVEDRIQARWICQELEAHGYHTIFPERDFPAGSNFVLEMERAVTASARTIAVISPAYLASRYTQPEWAVAFRRDPMGEQGLLIPVFVHPCEAEGLLGSILRINLIDKDEHQARKRLLQGVRQAPRVLSQVAFPSRVETSSPSSRICNIPFARNPLFTGREDLLHQLHQKLTSDTTSDATSATVAALTQPQALKGLGGIGKTQMAVEYAYRHQDFYPSIFWVNAATQEALITSFVAIAELLPSFPAKDEKDQNKVVEAVKRWLEQSESRWLLILDNADDVTLVRLFLPKSGNGSILLTTRAHAVGSIAASLEVEKMSLMEGTCLLLRRVYGLASHLSPVQVLEYASIEDTNEAGNIVAALDYLPLALDQAGAYIEETGCGFTGYLEVYSTYLKELLARRGIDSTNYPDTVATTWSLSFQKVEQANPAAAELLQLCAFLAPDRIPEELIKEGAAQWPHLLQKAATDLFAFQEIIAELLKFSLVKRLTDDHALSIHRLVQAVQRDMMKPEMQRSWAEWVVRAVNDAFPEQPQDVSTWPQCLRYLDQAQACSTLIEHYRFDFVEGASILGRTALYLTEHALYAVAEPLYERALAICEQQWGAEHPATAGCLNYLASLYMSQGKYVQAEPLYERALVIYEQQLGAEHPATARCLDNLALLYQNQRKYAQAELLHQRAFSIRAQQLGIAHLDTATSLNNLAELYRGQGKYAQAELLYEQALAIYEQQLGAEHPDIALSLDNLASLYMSQGKYAQAEPLLVRALTACEQQLGAEHPNTALSLGNLASLYESQGKYAQAELLYKRALAIREKQLGTEHPHTTGNLNNLASLYESQGKYAQAELLYKRALAIREQQLGTEHLDTALSLNGLASLYMSQGKYAQAEPLYIRVLAICERQLGAEHPNTADCLNNLAVLYKTQGKYVEAEPLYQRALHIQEQQLGGEHPGTAVSLNNLAGLYKTQGKYVEAEPLYQRALHIQEQQLGGEHPDVASSMSNLAGLYKSQGKYEEAEPLYQRALDIREEQLGATHPHTALSLNNLALLYSDQGKYAEAEPLLERSLRICEQQLGEQHPYTQEVRRNYVWFLRAIGREKEAILLEE